MGHGQINRVIEHLRKTLRAGDTAKISDGQLLECYATHRDERVFALLLERHGPMVLSVCKRVLGSHHDAEDAFQATFLVLARKASSIRPRAMVGNWLYGVAFKTALRARSVRAKRQVREKHMNPMPEREAPAQSSWRDVQPVLDEELSRLSDKYRLPIILCDLEGKSAKEAARHTGLCEGTFSSRLSRGRAMLAKRLARRGVTLSAAGLAALVLPRNIAACVPPLLGTSTVKAMRAFAAGQSLASLTSGPVVALVEGVLQAMLWTKLTSFAVALILIGSVSVGAWSQGIGTNGQAKPDEQAQPQAVVPKKAPAKANDPAQGFDQLSPVERIQLVGKVADPDKEFQAADRGDVVLSITARGSMEAVNSTDIFCEVRSQFVDPTIKSIVANGAFVHKGDVLVSLDDSYLQGLLKDRLKAYNLSHAAITTAEGALEQGKLLTELRQVDGEIALRTAELKLKRFAGIDRDEREILILEVQKARLSGQLAKLEGKSRLSLARADLEAKIAQAEVHRAQVEDVKEQIEKCTIKAPKDGVVVHYIPEDMKGLAAPPMLASGAKVHQGEKLLQMPDLNSMLVNIRVPETVVAFVRGDGRSEGQVALIKVDAYPKTTLSGHIKPVAPVLVSRSWVGKKKIYKAVVTIDTGKNATMPRLLPGMSAEVTIKEAARKSRVVRVPLKAVIQVGPKSYCYVKVGKEIMKREVVPGLRGHEFVEIQSGIQENDLVVRDAQDLVRRLNTTRGAGKE